MLKSFRELVAWQKAYELTLEIYRVTTAFPKKEIYGFVSQMRRAAVSIPSNIAEGYQRQSRKEYMQFLSIAYSSCGELETQLLLSHDLGFLDGSTFKKILSLQEEVSKLLFKLIRSLQTGSRV
jgi:four helix bundle protein